MDGERRYATVEEFARELGVHPKAVYRHVALGRLPVLRLGKRVFVDRHALGELVRKEPKRAAGS